MSAYPGTPTYKTLDEALTNSYRVNTLRTLAKMVCNEIPARKADIVSAICKAMLGPNLKSHFERLGKIDRAAVQEAVFSYEGRLDETQFMAKYEQAPPDNRSHSWDHEGDLVDLFLVDRCVPADLRKRLEEFVDQPKEDHVKYVTGLPETISVDIRGGADKRNLVVRHTATAALNNLQTVLRLVEAGKIKVGAKTGRPTSASQKNLACLLQDGDWYGENDDLDDIDYIQGFAWPILLQGAGLAKLDGSVLKLTDRGKKALNTNPPQVVKDMWSKWETNKLFDELSRVERIKGQTASRGRALFAAHTRRPVLYEGLSLCDPGKWLKVEELVRSMVSAGLDFEVARYAWKLYVGDAEYGRLDGIGGYAMVKLRYVLSFLFEYAATLGIIDVAYIHPENARSDSHKLWGWGMYGGSAFLSRYDGLQYIRINPLGAFAMEMAATYEAGPSQVRAVLTVLPNHDVVVTDASGLSPGDRLFLEKTCQKKSSSLWTLTTQTLLDAAQNGTNIDEIKAFLNSRSSQPVPKTVITLLDDANRRSAGLQYAGRTHLIACKDAMLQKLIASDSKLKQLCLPAGERHLVLMPGKETQFLSALARLGYIVPQLREQI
jgi:hypothetical protein